MAYTESYAGLGRGGFNPFRKGKKGVRGRKYLALGIGAGLLGYYGGKKAGLWGGGSPTQTRQTIRIPRQPAYGPPVASMLAPGLLGAGTAAPTTVYMPGAPAPMAAPAPMGFLASLRQLGTQQVRAAYAPSPAVYAPPMRTQQAGFLGMPKVSLVPLGIAAAALVTVLVVTRKRANRTVFQKLTGG